MFVVLRLRELGTSHFGVASGSLFFIQVCLQNPRKATVKGVRASNGAIPSLQGPLLLWLPWLKILILRFQIRSFSFIQILLYNHEPSSSEHNSQEPENTMDMFRTNHHWCFRWVFAPLFRKVWWRWWICSKMVLRHRSLHLGLFCVSISSRIHIHYETHRLRNTQITQYLEPDEAIAASHTWEFRLGSVGSQRPVWHRVHELKGCELLKRSSFN